MHRWRLFVLVAVLLAGCGKEGRYSWLAEPTPASHAAWRQIPRAPSGVTFNPVVWTGTELIVWGLNEQRTREAGAAYDPARDSWRRLPASPIGGRSGHSAVWTGTEVIYWGGGTGAGQAPRRDGVAYNPSTDRWRRVPSGPEGRAGHEAVWTGTEMIVWGGFGGGGVMIDSVFHHPAATAYDSRTDRWHGVARVPVPWSGDDGPAVSFGAENRMLVWRRGALGQFDVATNKWTSLGKPSLPIGNCSSTGGPDSIGTRSDDDVLIWTGGCGPTVGVAYNLSSKRWRRIADITADIRTLGSADGVVYGAGGADDVSPVRLNRYSLTDDRWSVIRPAPVELGVAPFVVWTGKEVLVWGGYRKPGEPPTGAAYTP